LRVDFFTFKVLFFFHKGHNTLLAINFLAVLIDKVGTSDCPASIKYKLKTAVALPLLPVKEGRQMVVIALNQSFSSDGNTINSVTNLKQAHQK
jgi:hypothetical protein